MTDSSMLALKQPLNKRRPMLHLEQMQAERKTC